MARALLLGVLLAAALAPALQAQGERPVVVCTTTVLASMVRDLAGDLVVIEVIASPAVCPAHYDVRPSDVEAFGRADLILAHGIEPWVSELREASGSKAPVVWVRGPWNTPEALKARYREVAAALEEHLGLSLSDRLAKCLKAIDETDALLRAYAREHGFLGTPVVCMLWQKAFISYLGFRIVAVYGPPEKVSAKQFEGVLRNASKAGALLVIDNLQSGQDLGRRIASEVGCVQVALSNFPWTSPELTNMTEVMKWNARRLARALALAKLRGEVSRLRSELEMWRIATIVSAVIAIALSVAYLRLVLRLRRR